MKKHYLLIAIFAMFGMLLSADKAKASHATGGELIYIHLGDSAYQFIFKFYRDCSGIAAPTTGWQICAWNKLTNQALIYPLTEWKGPLPPDGRKQGDPISPGCSNAATRCDNPPGSVPGYQEYWFDAVLPRLPFRTEWKFGVINNGTSLCCRNPINNIASTNFYLESGLNSTFTFKNSSPYYSIKPVPYVCLGQPFQFNNGALDADGDSLWSYLTNALATTHCTAPPAPIPFTAGANPPYQLPNNPFQTNNTFFLNGWNGQFGFTSGMTGAGAITTITDEYRRGSLPTYKVGFIMRDVQAQTIACSTVLPKLDTFTIDPTNGDFFDGKVWGCVEQPMDFCMLVHSADTETVLKVSDNLLNITTMPGATINYSGMATDSVEVCFNWTPRMQDIGPHQIILLVRDSTCKPPGILFNYAFPVDIQIWGAISASERDTICAGEPAFLGVTGGGDYRWKEISPVGSPNTLNDTTIANPAAYPKVTTTYLVRSTLNDYCNYGTTDTVIVDVIQGTEITGQPDTTICPNFTTQLNIGMVREPNVNYTIGWSPTTGVDKPTVENPSINLKADQQYIVSIVSTKNRCVTRDTIDVDVLEGLKIDNIDTAICFGKSVNIVGTGDSRYVFSWESTTDQQAQYGNPGGVQTSIVPSDTGEHVYVLSGSYLACPSKDTTASIKITTQPIPVVSVNDDESMCQGDTMQLEGIVTPNTYGGYSYSWTPGAMLDFPDRRKPIFSATDIGKFTLTFVTSTSAGCSDTDQVELEVFTSQFMTMPNDTAICPGDTISLNMAVQEGAKFYWLPDYNISSISSIEPRVWPITDQVYAAYGIDTFGCLDTQYVKVTVRPRAVLDMPDSVVIYPGESYRVDPGGNCLYYTWFPPLGLSDAEVSNPMVSPKVNTRYIVHGRTETGCSVTDSLNVLVRNDGFLNLPNAFTPGNGANGKLRIIRRGVSNLKSFAVYNRWGTKVFETSNINEGWDGTFNGEAQPMGVYIYTIEAVGPSGETIRKQGNVTMIK